jgi:hypothetical protein
MNKRFNRRNFNHNNKYERVTRIEELKTFEEESKNELKDIVATEGLHYIDFLKSSEYEEQFVKRFTVDKNKAVQFNEAKHLKMLFNVYRNLGGVSQFCAAACISTDTFKKWLVEYPNFKEAFDTAVNIGRTLWEQTPLEKKLDYQYWSNISKSRYNAQTAQIDFSKTQTLVEELDAIKAALQEGKISVSDLNNITDFLAKKQAMLNNNLEDDRPKITIEFVKPQSQ